jgi:hypothetical protein
MGLFNIDPQTDVELSGKAESRSVIKCLAIRHGARVSLFDKVLSL